MNPDLANLVIGAIAWIISVGLHEAGHAFVADGLGDPTPEAHGRLTLNPFAHLKPVDTAIVIPLVSLFLIGYPMGAASTPIDPTRFRRPSRDRMIVSLAGPVVNLLLAVVFSGLFLLLRRFAPPDSFNFHLFQMLVILNVILALFNLIPIPPLDGGDVLRYFLPEGGKLFLDRLRQFGFIIAILILRVPAVNAVFFAAIALVQGFVFGDAHGR